MGPLLLSRPATVPRQAQRPDTLCNQQVRCSSPSTSSKLPLQRPSEYGGIPEWPKGADCKSVVSDFGGSNPPSPTKKSDILRVMFVGTQVDTISCKGAGSVCCPLSCVFSLLFIMREARIPRLRAAQCAAAPRPAPSRCPPCRCRGTRCGCSGGSCGSISPSARLPRSSG